MAEQSETQPLAKPEAQSQELFLPAPLLLDAVRYLVELGAVVFALMVFAISLVNGAEPFAAGARAAAALFAIGMLGWIVTYLLANTFLWLLGTLKPKTKEETPPISTKSWEA